MKDRHAYSVADVTQIVCNSLSVGLFVLGNMNVPHTLPQMLMLGGAAVLQALYQGIRRVERKESNGNGGYDNVTKRFG